MSRQPAIIIAKAINMVGIDIRRASRTAAVKRLTPQARKKEKAVNWARKSVRQKMPFTAVTTGSFNEVMNPQAKNRVVTTRKAASAPRLERDAFMAGHTDPG